jgi:transposase
MVHFNENHAIPLKRTATLMEDLFHMPMSQATVVKAAIKGAEILQPTVNAIGQAAVNSAVVNADETGVRVDKISAFYQVDKEAPEGISISGTYC